MSNFTLGRIGIDADIDDVSQWDQSGESVTVSFSTPMIAEGGSLERSNAYRQMLLGYAESPDQRFVPVTWIDDPSANGYYRVRSATVSPDPDLALEGLYYFSASLERVDGYAMPAIQTTYLFRERTNVHDVSAVAYLGQPNAPTRWGYAYEPEDGTYSNQSPAHSYATSDGGTVGAVQASISGGSGPAAGELALWIRNIEPWGYYYGSARFEVNGYAVEGRQVPDNWENEWRLTNGAIELMMDASAGGDVVFQMRGWDGAQWDDPVPITILADDSAVTPRDALVGPDTVTILKNSAEEVIIRFGCHVGNRNWPVFLDITCRRGSRNFSCRMRRASGTGNANPGINLPDMFDYGWRREGAWVLPGTLTEEMFIWNPRALLDDLYFDLVGGVGTYTGRLTGVTGVSGISTAVRATASGAHTTTTFGLCHGVVGTSTPNSGFSSGNQYTFAVWVRCSVSRSVRARVTWRTSSGASISTVASADTALTANTWQRITFTATAPATTARVSLEVTGNSGGAAWAAGQTLDITGVQAELGATIDDFWDGDNGASDGIIYAYAYTDGPNNTSWKFTRTGLPTYWWMSPVETTQDTDGWEPLADPDPASWEFGFGMIPAGVNGDEGRYLREVQSYYMSISQRDDVVAV